MKYDYSEKYAPESETPTWALSGDLKDDKAFARQLRDAVLCTLLLGAAALALVLGILSTVEPRCPTQSCVERAR